MLGPMPCVENLICHICLEYEDDEDDDDDDDDVNNSSNNNN